MLQVLLAVNTNLCSAISHFIFSCPIFCTFFYGLFLFGWFLPTIYMVVFLRHLKKVVLTLFHNTVTILYINFLLFSLCEWLICKEFEQIGKSYKLQLKLSFYSQWWLLHKRARRKLDFLFLYNLWDFYFKLISISIDGMPSWKKQLCIP